MKIQYLSDLHLEFYNDDHISIIEKYIDTKDTDVLILAGDIDVWSVGWESSPIYNWFSKNFKHTIYIPGNHEYYPKKVKLSKKPINYKIRDNVYIIDNDYIDIDNVRFIGSTLWSNIFPDKEFQIMKSMNDFKKIQQDEINTSFGYESYKLSVPFLNEVNKISKDFIFNNLSNEKNNLVITHHLPSFSCISPVYKGNVLNSAFANNDLDYKIMDSNIKYWIYGHSHGNMDDFYLNNTMLTANQLGYPHEITRSFKSKFIHI